MSLNCRLLEVSLGKRQEGLCTCFFFLQYSKTSSLVQCCSKRLVWHSAAVAADSSHFTSQQGDSGVFLCYTFIPERGKGLRTAFNKGTQLLVFITPPELIKILTFLKKKKLPMGMKRGFKKITGGIMKKDHFQNKLFGLEFLRENKYVVQFVSLLCLIRTRGNRLVRQAYQLRLKGFAAPLSESELFLAFKREKTGRKNPVHLKYFKAITFWQISTVTVLRAITVVIQILKKDEHLVTLFPDVTELCHIQRDFWARPTRKYQSPFSNLVVQISILVRRAPILHFLFQVLFSKTKLLLQWSS